MLQILDSFPTSRETPLRAADDIRLVRRPSDGLCAVVRVEQGTVYNLGRTVCYRPYGERAVSYVANWIPESYARGRFTRARREHSTDTDQE